MAYLFIKQLQKHGLTLMTLPLLYLHRILRLTPSLALGTYLSEEVQFTYGIDGVLDQCSIDGVLAIGAVRVGWSHVAILQAMGRQFVRFQLVEGAALRSKPDRR